MNTENSPTPFSDRLVQSIRSRGTPLVVGIDPRWERLPPSVRGTANESGAAREVRARAFAEFGTGVIDAIADLVPAIKPQAAFFEELGPAGMEALSRVVDHGIASGLMIIMDAKRGDIGSTAEAYARAFLGRKPHSAWGCDALTVNPYLGDDSLTPFVQRCSQTGAGIFVLVKTSNPGSRTLQDLKVDSTMPLYRVTAEWVQGLAHASQGAGGYGDVGAVIGATHPQQLSELRAAMPNTLFLIPGFGAQGGTAAGVAGGFDADGLGAIVNSSRAIIFAHERQQYSSLDWLDAVRRATIDSIEQLAAETPAGKLRR